THTGSLPRGEPLSSLLIDQEQGEPVSRDALESAIEARVAHVLAKQADVGIDIANDGEQGRVGFQTYLMQRMSGFGGVSKRPYGKEFLEFPQFTERMMQRIPKTGKVFDAPQAVDEIRYLGTALLDAEIERLGRLAKPRRAQFADLFMNAPSPGIVACTMLNAYYDSQQAYLDAIARELRVEYRRVVEAGFVLQIDAPDLAMERVLLYQDLSDAEFAQTVELHVAALNKALEGLPRERVRLHVCWGNWEGPHNHDVDMELLLPALYDANVGALGLEFANPRRQHEVAAIAKRVLPDNLVLIAGVIDSKSNFVEHPEVIAQRIEAVARAVGDPARVVAGVDCGFGTFVGWEWVTEDVVWAKLKSLREGAERASARLFGRTRATAA
ncbi:MAG TPA: cobalamin-independent methionine synthase II family protein, partial [Gammaproteobacteria bacterium]|nr:cobalamin-independent methionine synthase II family protein [Gammaproteobacteria bacterium]